MLSIITQGYGFGSSGVLVTQGYGFGAPVPPVTPSAPPGPGKAKHCWTESSDLKKRRKKRQQALLLNDFDFLAAQKT